MINETKSDVNYLGWVSDSFAVYSGIRQGCPFSPIDFVLAIELLAIKIRASKDIRGIRHWNVNDVNFDYIVKIALYADDITLFLNDETDLQCALGIFDGFSHISGLMINKRKSEAMWLDSKKHCDLNICRFCLEKETENAGCVFLAVIRLPLKLLKAGLNE